MRRRNNISFSLLKVSLPMSLLFFLILHCVGFALCYSPPTPPSRREFLSTKAKTAFLPILLDPALTNAAPAVSIKVTPLAHTFVVSSGSGTTPSVKPIRENDATRIFTNAKIALFFLTENVNMDSDDITNLISLIAKCKIDQGAGVTPGKVNCLLPVSSTKLVAQGIPSDVNVDSYDPSKSTLVEVLSSKYGDIMNEGGDTVMVFLSLSEVQNSASNCAKKFQLYLGKEKGGGVVSALFNGSTNFGSEGDLKGLDLLWYSV